jgi:hypothetical protein
VSCALVRAVNKRAIALGNNYNCQLKHEPAIIRKAPAVLWSPSSVRLAMKLVHILWVDFAKIIT